MDKENFQKYLSEAKAKLGVIIKNEIKRKFIGETYSYLIKIPDVTFWLVAVVTTFAVFTIELLVAGVVIGEQVVVYGDLLLGYVVAAVIGLIVGKLYSRKVSKKVHGQIADILKVKNFDIEELLKKGDGGK